MSSFSRRLVLCFTFIQCLTIGDATQTCYWPDGSIAESGAGLPCGSNNEVSHCCSERDACLENGLCYGTGVGVPYRGSCTDQNWNSTKCPKLCNDRTSISSVSCHPVILPLPVLSSAFPHLLLVFSSTMYNTPELIWKHSAVMSNTWANLINCPANGQFWCGDLKDPGPCATGTSASYYTWPSPTGIQTVLGLKDQSPQAVPTSTGVNTAVAVAATGSTPAPTSVVSHSGVNTATAVGAGVGVPLGILVVGLLTLLFWRERRKMAGQRASTDGTFTEDQKAYERRPIAQRRGLINEKEGQMVAAELPDQQEEHSQELDGRSHPALQGR